MPCILSIIVVSKNQKLYGFNVKPDPPLNFETFELPGQTDLKVVADLIGVPYEVVQDLNPELRRGTSPAGQRYGIKLPRGMKKQFEVAYADLPFEKRCAQGNVPVMTSRRRIVQHIGFSWFYRVRAGRDACVACASQ